MAVHLIETMAQAREAARDLEGKFMAFDTETTDRWRDPLTYIFENASEVVGHNTKFDIHAMVNYGINVNELLAPSQIHDTIWVARLHDERDIMKLKSLAVKYLDADAAASQGTLRRMMTKNKWTWATVPIRHLVEYGGLDAIYTGLL